MRKILITGVTGFIGKALSEKLMEDNFALIYASVRQMSNVVPKGVIKIEIGELAPDTDWTVALSGVSVVIHLAARVHLMNETSADSLELFRKTNKFATLNLARQAVKMDVCRFIYLSSIKVNGEETFEGSCFVPESTHIPIDPYGLSKYEAEQGLNNISAGTGLQVVIIRPPLVYGPNVKANFRSMMSLLSRRVPLPFGAIHNRRSFVALDNLINLIIVCIDHPEAANQIFLVSDDEDLSTTELLQRIVEALDKTSFLIPIPARFLLLAAAVIGKSKEARRLCGSLRVDIDHTKKVLGWKPIISLDQAVKETVAVYLNSLKR